MECEEKEQVQMELVATGAEETKEKEITERQFSKRNLMHKLKFSKDLKRNVNIT